MKSLFLIVESAENGSISCLLSRLFFEPFFEFGTCDERQLLSRPRMEAALAFELIVYESFFEAGAYFVLLAFEC